MRKDKLVVNGRGKKMGNQAAGGHMTSPGLTG